MQWRVGTIQAHHMTLIKSLALQSPSRRPLMTTKIKFAIAGFDTFFSVFDWDRAISNGAKKQ